MVTLVTRIQSSVEIKRLSLEKFYFEFENYASFFNWKFYSLPADILKNQEYNLMISSGYFDNYPLSVGLEP